MATDSDAGPLRVAVLYGGDSSEREISLASGIAVAAALTEHGHTVRALDPAQVELVDMDWRGFDVCFNALHGGRGEDGRLQTLLDSLGVPYTGSQAPASRLASNKQATKEVLLAQEIPTPAFLTVGQHESIRETLRRVAEFGYPVVVKPNSQGSSLGVGLAWEPEALECQIAESRLYEADLVVERYIAGRECTVAVLDREPLEPIEILCQGELFNYEAKYFSTATEFEASPDWPAALSQQVMSLAAKAVAAIDTRGVARVDFRITPKGQPWVLEVNTSPGMTDHSLVPLAARRAGMPMHVLCDHLVRSALAARAQA